MKLTINKAPHGMSLIFYNNGAWFGYAEHQYRRRRKYSRCIRRYNADSKTFGYCDSVNTIFFI